jgi:hypothetical protein
MLVALAMAAACTGTTTNPSPGQVPTTTSTPVPTTVATIAPGTPAITPGPTQTMPGYQQLDFQIDKDPVSVNSLVTVSFRGGRGQSQLVSAVITFTSADGRQETQTMNRPGVGQEVTFQGTRGGSDRVEITVFMNDGTSYKIVDTLVSVTRP